MSLKNKEVEFSVVIPVFNEEGNLRPLIDLMKKACEGYSYEILIIDDGSHDGTVQEIKNLAQADPLLHLIRLKRNFGQTAALAVGFDQAQGTYIIPMDGDGQNDPNDIPHLLSEIKKGFDVVSGWRKDRKDFFLTRTLPSYIANKIISWITGLSLHDYGCTLKIYRSALIKDIEMSGEMHRFLPAWCAWRGGKISECVVQHHPRKRGQSKYGLFRTFKVLIDLLTLKFFSGYLSKPNHLFSGGAFILLGLSLISTGVAFYDKFGPDRIPDYRIPLLLLAAVLMIVAIFMILLGFVAELLVRLYFTIRQQKNYIIENESTN